MCVIKHNYKNKLTRILKFYTQITPLIINTDWVKINEKSLKDIWIYKQKKITCYMNITICFNTQNLSIIILYYYENPPDIFT